MLSLRGKRNNCGPPCELCFSPVLSDKIYRKNRVYHLRCFPCKLCKKNGRCIDIYGDQHASSGRIKREQGSALSDVELETKAKKIV